MSELLADVDATRRRMWADRPSPALPLALLAAVVVGGIGMTFVETDRHGMYFNDGLRLGYWCAATLLAFGLMILIARRQGYRTGVWVNRRVLVIAGVVSLAAIALAVLYGTRTPLLPGDLVIRGNLPLLAITVGIAFWAYRERRPGLWVVAGLLAPLTLLANLYNMENLLFRLGVPFFEYADEVVNLAAVAIVLLVAAVVFSLSRRRSARLARSGR